MCQLVDLFRKGPIPSRLSNVTCSGPGLKCRIMNIKSQRGRPEILKVKKTI